MIEITVIAVLSALMGYVAYQDFTERAISVWTLVVFLLLSFCLGSLHLDFETLIRNGLINMGFIVTQLAFIALYFSIKNRKFVNVADEYIGWGDILFFVPLAILFSTEYFMLFYVGALLVSLVGFLIYKVLINRTVATIPLAGLLAFCLVAVLCSSWWLDLNLYGSFLI